MFQVFKFNIDGVEGVYVYSDDINCGGHSVMDTTMPEVLLLIKEIPRITRKTLSETICLIGVANWV